MGNLTKRFLLIGCFSVIGFVFASFARWPANNLTCQFTAKSTGNRYSFGALKQPIQNISVAGFVDDPFEDELYRFSGNAVVQANDEKIDASVRGRVFIDSKGQVIGTLLTLDHERFGQDWLKIFTLDAEGVSDYNKSDAFLFSKLVRGDPFRLTYPVSMNCVSKL